MRIILYAFTIYILFNVHYFIYALQMEKKKNEIIFTLLNCVIRAFENYIVPAPEIVRIIYQPIYNIS